MSREGCISFFPVQEVMDALGCADNKATKLFRELEKFGLIERKRRGLGKPNLIYVKNFADPRFRNREKNGSGCRGFSAAGNGKITRK